MLKEFCSPPRKLVTVLRKGRDAWKVRAQKQQQRAKALDGKVRDLVRSRDHWKTKAKKLKQQLRELEQTGRPSRRARAPSRPPIPQTRRRSGPRFVAARPRPLLPAPKRQGFSLDLIQFAVQSLMDGLSLRQVEKVLARLGSWLGFDGPDFTTVRLWVQRVGLYLWQRTPPRADDWIWILDHIAESGGGKCLVIVGVRRVELRGRDFVLRHTDVMLLYAETMRTCTGDDMYRILVALAAVCGVPVQIVSDHGSDVLKGERLFQAEHASVVLTWDITHRSARLLLAAVKGDETWVAFKAACQRTRTAVERTPWSALAPPSTAGASRCEHFDTLVLWGAAALAKLDAGASGVIDREHAWDDAAAYALRAALSAAEQERLKPLLGRSFADAEAFGLAVTNTLGPSEHTAAIVRESDQGRRRGLAQFGWLEAYRERLRAEYVPLVQMTYSAEEQVKHEGLHGRSAAEWRTTQPPLPRGATRSATTGRNSCVTSAPRAAAARAVRRWLPPRTCSNRCSANTNVTQSVARKHALNSAILTLPVATEELTPDLIERAIVTTPLKSLQRWCRETFGRTKLAVQRLLNDLAPDTESA